MLKPRRSTGFFWLVIYLKETEPGLSSVACEPSYYLGKDGNMENTYLVWKPILSHLLYLRIGDNTTWEDTCSKQPIATLSKCQHLKHNHK